MAENSTLRVEQVVLRRKILGVKIRHARARAGLSPTEVGQVLGISAELVSDIEFGRRDVTLPQLEVMSMIFNVPISYFWSDDAIEEPNLDYPTQEAMALRHRIIGTLLRQARTEAGQSQEELAQLLGVPPSRIPNYEFGKTEIPLPELELLAEHLNVSLSYFMDEDINAKEFADVSGITTDEISHYSELPADVQEFLSNPANLLYIHIAMKLSEVSAETLRGLAEGLLEVTY